MCFSFSSPEARAAEPARELLTIIGVETGSHRTAAPREKCRASQSRAYRLLVVTLLLRPFGNLCLAWGTKHFPQVLAVDPVIYLRAMMNPYIAAGIMMLIAVTLMRIALLSLADLSFVVPLTAMGYIVSTLLGKFFLQEQITIARWTGILLIFAGTALVSSTSRKTTGAARLDEDSVTLLLPEPH